MYLFYSHFRKINRSQWVREQAFVLSFEFPRYLFAGNVEKIKTYEAWVWAEYQSDILPLS
jgi:hypothetical protein